MEMCIDLITKAKEQILKTLRLPKDQVTISLCDSWTYFTGAGADNLAEHGLGLLKDELWSRCNDINIVLDDITPWGQELDVVFNGPFKSQMNEAHLHAAQRDEFKSYFKTITGKEKAGHQYVSAKACELLFRTEHTIQNEQRRLKEGWSITGFALNPWKVDDDDNREKLLLKNVFGCCIGEETLMNQGISRLTGGFSGD